MAKKIGLAILVIAALAAIGALVYFVSLSGTQIEVPRISHRVEIQNIKVDWGKDESGDPVFKPAFDVVNKEGETFTGYVFVYAQNNSISPAAEGSWPSWASVSAGEPKDPRRGYKIIIDHRISIAAEISAAPRPEFNQAWVMVYDEEGMQVNRTRVLGPDL
jgi:hypothetical protein